MNLFCNSIPALIRNSRCALTGEAQHHVAHIQQSKTFNQLLSLPFAPTSTPHQKVL